MIEEVKRLLVKVCEAKDSESFRLLASFVAAVEAGYKAEEIIPLVEGWGNATR